MPDARCGPGGAFIYGGVALDALCGPGGAFIYGGVTPNARCGPGGGGGVSAGALVFAPLVMDAGVFVPMFGTLSCLLSRLLTKAWISVVMRSSICSQKK